MINDIANVPALKETTGRVPSRAFLPIVRSKLISRNNTAMVATLLDSGSEVNIISRKMANQLGLKGEPFVIDTIGVGAVSTQQFTEKVQLFIEDIMGRETYIEAIILNKACGNALPIPSDVIEKISEKFHVNPRSLFTSGGEIDLLLGMSVPQLHKQSGMQIDDGLCLIETRFGPCVTGKSNTFPNGNYESSLLNVNYIQIKEEVDMWRFLEAEIAGVNKECPCQKKSDEEVKYEQVMDNAWSRDEAGRFQVKLPWKIDPNTLPNNKSQALQRDVNLRTQLAKNSKVKELFSEQIQEMIKIGVIRKVEDDYPRRYLPMLAVTKMDRETTKVRICLDAKTKFQRSSLNDALLKGKLEMPDILQVVTKFRVGKFAMVGDIQKMFWQIRLHPDDQKYHGVIWNEDTYVFTRVCFGDKASPPIAEESMIKMAHIGKDTHPEASKTLINRRYMDDIVESGNNGYKLQQKSEEIDKLLGEFGFNIKKWYSNIGKLENMSTSKLVLGCKWIFEEDTLSIKIPKEKFDIVTKRTVLSRIAEIWDPLGMSIGVLISARLIFQSIVRLKLEWDEPVKDTDLLQKWKSIQQNISKCNELLVKRNIWLPQEMSKNGERIEMKCSMVGFCDGSSVANGCVLYLRFYNEDESIIDIRFVAAKGKLSPIKGITIPRNELCGALLLARLTSSVLKAFESTELTLSPNDVKLFSDSTTVLSWVKADATKFKPFVKNKIIEIQDLLTHKVWKYIPSSKNTAADLISKGCKYEQ